MVQRRALLAAAGGLMTAMSASVADAMEKPERTDASGMIKFICLIPRRKDFTREQFFVRWENGHGALMRRNAAVLGVRKYVQSHRLDTPAMKEFMALRGWPDVDYDGLTEVWLDSLESFDASTKSPTGAAAIKELAHDEAQFCDQSHVLVFMSVEHRII